MKRLMVLFFTISFLFGLMFFISCGGKSKKINEVAQEESNVLNEEAEAKKAELPTTYIVEAGDKLWTIAEKPEIYGNKWQWPLIYDANRDILDTYDSLKEGQKLIIPRNVSAVEIEAAKERAMELGIPPSKKSVKVKEETEEIAGLNEEAQGTQEADKGKSSVKEIGVGMEAEEEPTPIPELPAKKKGGVNVMGIIIGLLLVLAIIILFFFYQQKKKEEEEEETKTDDTGSGGSGGILT